MLERLADLEQEFESVEARLADPAVLADQTQLRELSRRHKELEPVVAAARSFHQAVSDRDTAKEMLPDLTGDDRDVVRAWPGPDRQRRALAAPATVAHAELRGSIRLK